MEKEEKVRHKVKGKLGIDNKKLSNSFKYAFQGIDQAFKGEQNLRIHFFVTIIVILFGIFLQISYTEWLICFVLIGMVIVAELFNTSIEYVVDLCSPHIHPLAKAAKDTAAAGVVFSAIIAAIIGLLIFVPKIIVYIGGLL